MHADTKTVQCGKKYPRPDGNLIHRQIAVLACMRNHTAWDPEFPPHSTSLNNTDMTLMFH